MYLAKVLYTREVISDNVLALAMSILGKPLHAERFFRKIDWEAVIVTQERNSIEQRN